MVPRYAHKRTDLFITERRHGGHQPQQVLTGAAQPEKGRLQSGAQLTIENPFVNIHHVALLPSLDFASRF